MNLDGQQVTNQVALSFGQPRYSRDSIGEFEFVTNRFDASQGRSSGVQVNAITKSGTNTPTGTFSGYFRDDTFNAKDPVTHTVLPYQDQQISTTFGGPIRKDRIHYFASYEYEREPQTYVYATPYPKFNGTLTGARRQDTEAGRLDFQFSPKTRLSLRGNRYDNRIPYDSRYTGGSDRTPASAIGTNRRSEQELATLTQVLNSRMVNEIKGGHSLFHWNQFAHVNNAGSLIGQTSGFGAPVINLRGFTLGQTHAITPQNIREEDYDIQDSFTASFNKRGRHDVKLGGEYMHDFTWETTCQTCMGQFTSNNGTLTPQAIQDMIRDVNDVTTWSLAPLSPVTTVYLRNVAMPSSPFSRPSGNNGFTEYAPRHVAAWWAQDDWHATGKLTLNLGMRYDANIGEFVNWVGFEPFIHANRPNDLNNFAPRLGFTYSLTDKTVLRGGYGKYFSEGTGQPPLFTLRYVQQIAMTVNNDGRPDFAVNPFNGPAPTYDQAKALLRSSQPNRRRRPATCGTARRTSRPTTSSIRGATRRRSALRVSSARRCRSRPTGSTRAIASCSRRATSTSRSTRRRARRIRSSAARRRPTTSTVRIRAGATSRCCVRTIGRTITPCRPPSPSGWRTTGRRRRPTRCRGARSSISCRSIRTARTRCRCSRGAAWCATRRSRWRRTSRRTSGT
ncbi:MAG: hypothetical protein DMF87_24020 [Acidobacteria bacterium]|nr:MAG: hypothetical protein DMF87_24020 [Acidobacteriota bacterium]